MDRDEIKAMEPKYTGNTRHLTEGEAAAIKNNDPTYEGDEDGLLERIPPVLLLGINRPQ
jgi:hypothetical protein